MPKRPHRTLYLDVCFECGEPAEHQHHVIPQVMGGTQTVPLCNDCHSKIHGISLATGALVSAGIAKAKAAGTHVGGVRYGKSYSKTALNASGKRAIIPNREEMYILGLIRERREQNIPYQEIADELNAQGYTTRRGSSWSARNVSDLYRSNP